MRCLVAACALHALVVTRVEGQADSGPHAIRWWEAAAVVGVVGATTVFDRGLDDWFQDHRSSRSNSVARVFKNGGQPAFFLTVGGGILAAGVVSGRPELRRAGGRVLASIAVAGLTTVAIKKAVGRLRPDNSSDQYVFRPFSHKESFPSGHAAIAFSLATSLSEEIHHHWASALLYTAAAGTAWSRLNDHRHWCSDVLGGATIGITAAKVMEGRWRVFGLGPPKFLIDPVGARLEWRVRF